MEPWRLHPGVADVLARVAGQRCWGVRRGVGSFLTLELGGRTSHVVPSYRLPAASPSRPAPRTLKRRVVVHGEWHLWVYRSRWRVAVEGRAEPQSDVLQRLRGRRLTSVAIRHGSVTTTFTFGERAPVTLKTSADRACRGADQWLLYTPEKDVLVVRGTGEFALQRSDMAASTWRPLWQRGAGS